MVLREGVETVLILAGVSFNSTELMSFIVPCWAWAWPWLLA